MSQAIFTSLSPNTEPDDIRLARQLFLGTHHSQSVNDDIIRSKATISQYVGQSHVTLTSSGRGALYEALRAADIGAGDEVIVQAFTCLAVPAAVTWTGATPIFADIAEGTYNLSAKTVAARLTSRTKVLVIQHTFGIPAPLDELIALARQHNLLVIEDVAHALGSTYHNKPVGSFGDIAILSFGRDKTISTVFGGAIATSQQHLHDAVTKNMAAYQNPPRWWVYQQLHHILLVNALLPIYFLGGLGKILLVMAQQLRLLSLAVSGSEKKGHPPHFLTYQFSFYLAPLLVHQLAKLDRYTKHRRQVAAEYAKVFGTPVVPAAAEPNWLRFPLNVTERDKALATGKRIHILLGDWYTTPVAPLIIEQTSVTHYVPGSCPVAEEACATVINLPTHIRLTPTDTQRVIDTIKSFT